MEVYYENGSQFNLNCTNFTVEDLRFLSRLRNITAFVCAAITLAILIFLICCKAFTSLFYETLLLLGSWNALHWNHCGSEHRAPVVLWRAGDSLCVGWFFRPVDMCPSVNFVLWVVLHLLCLVVSQICGSQPFPQCTSSRCCTVTVEIIDYILHYHS